MSAPAGWLPDPDDDAQLRFWDGASWTDFRRPAEAPPSAFSPAAAEHPSAATAPGAATGPLAWKVALGIFGALLFLALVVSLLSGR